MPIPPNQDRGESRRGPGFNLDISLAQPCLLSFEGDKERFKTSVIGFEPYQFIIIRLPAVPGIQQKLALGRGITLRLECDGTLWGFNTNILKAVMSPTPMLVVAYPYSAERLHLRKHHRTPCFLPARLANDFLDAAGLVTDISLGGCHMILDGAWTEKVLNIMTGDPVTLSWRPDDESLLQVDATVHKRTTGRTPLSLGLEFSSLVPESQEMLERFVSRLEEAKHALEQDNLP